MSGHVTMFTFPPVLYTSRLAITPLADTDYPFMRTLVNTPGWLAFIGDREVHNDEAAIAYVQRMRSLPLVRYAVVRNRGDNRPLGAMTFIRKDYLPGPDIGFAFLPDAMGQGYATEAVSALVDAVFSQLEEPLYAVTLPHNERSAQLLLRLGMMRLPDVFASGNTLACYTLTPSAWKSNRSF